MPNNFCKPIADCMPSDQTICFSSLTPPKLHSKENVLSFSIKTPFFLLRRGSLLLDNPPLRLGQYHHEVRIDTVHSLVMPTLNPNPNHLIHCHHQHAKM